MKMIVPSGGETVVIVLFLERTFFHSYYCSKKVLSFNVVSQQIFFGKKIALFFSVKNIPSYENMSLKLK